MLITIEFIDTLLPEPVAPATRRWGIFSRSAIIGFPNISLPRPSVSLELLFLKFSDDKISLNDTVSLWLFGTSKPNVALPAIGETLTLCALRARARSSARETTLFIFTPGARR